MMIGSSPWGEDCAQTTNPLYVLRATLECNTYKAQLRRHYSAAHDGQELPCLLTITENPHDFGVYYTVDAVFSDDDEAAVTAAYWLEAQGPELWDEIARQELGMPAEETHAADQA